MTSRALARINDLRYRSLLNLEDRGEAVPPWMSDPLIATTAARNKLRAWVQRTPRPWTSPAPADVLVRQTCVGDEVLAHVIARVISERLPPPVASYVVDTVCFITVGARIAGFCSAPLPKRPWLIVVVHTAPDDEAAVGRFRRVLAHEIAHSWTLPEPMPGDVAAGAFWMDTVHGVRLEHVPATALDTVRAERQAYVDGELLARRLTRVWGFGDL